MREIKKRFYQDDRFWIGVGAYYLLSYILAFYPALVFSIQAVRWMDYTDIETGGFTAGGYFWCLVLWIVFSFLISRMISVIEKSWPVLLFLYLITLWPFIQFAMFYLPDGPYEESIYTAVFPGFDWRPFIFN